MISHPTHHIDVSSVLRGTVCDLYSNLVTRPTGAAVRTAIEQQVAEIGAPAVTTIDFSQVMLLDFSCADEIVAKLLLRYAHPDGPDGYVLFRGIHEGHLDPVEAVLERHALALVAWYDGHAELFGAVTDEERLVWEYVRDAGPANNAEMAQALGLPLSDVDVLVHQLCGRRVLMRQATRYLIPGSTPGRH